MMANPTLDADILNCIVERSAYSADLAMLVVEVSCRTDIKTYQIVRIGLREAVRVQYGIDGPLEFRRHCRIRHYGIVQRQT